MLQNRQQIGKLDRRITFQEMITGTNASNENEELGWQNLSDVPSVWASVSDGFGTEEHNAEKLVAVQTTTFTIRYRDDLSMKYRILVNNVPYNILSIKRPDRKGYLEIVAESGGEYVELQESGFSSGFSEGFA